MGIRLIILGATGSLGGHVLRQALAAGHDVSVLVRNPSSVPPDVRDRLSIHTADLKDPVPPEVMREHDALINCAGHVADGQRFVDLVNQVIGSVETLPERERPVCWFLAGAALLDIDGAGRRGVDLPEVRTTYWPHLANFERLVRSDLEWRLLCPGPMVERQAVALDRLRISLDRLPVEVPAFASPLPDPILLREFVSLIPRITVPYADAAALMLANLEPGSRMTRHRVGLAPPAEGAVAASVETRTGKTPNNE